MTRTIWLASYPKSGNTWMRVLIGNARMKDDALIGLDAIATDGSAMERQSFDLLMLVDSGLLTHDEIDCLRPRSYEAIARDLFATQVATVEAQRSMRFAKVHDAYTLNSAGEPLLGGAKGADGAILVIRDPRDVALSLANFMNFSVDDAIAFMNRDDAALSYKTTRQPQQFRQKLRDWSAHAASWLDQTDIPVHLVRYEDLQRDTASTLRRALAFAGFSVTDQQIIRAVAGSNFALLRRQEQQNGFAEVTRPGLAFFRRGETGNWRKELTREQVARVEVRHGRVMSRLGYELSCAAELASAV